MAWPIDGRSQLSSLISGNSAFEVYAQKQFWRDETIDGVDQLTLGSMQYPIVQICANPNLITGNNAELMHADDTNPLNENRYSERPALMCLNLPPRLTAPLQDPSPDLDYVHSTAQTAEPDALAVRFGYTDKPLYFGEDAHDQAYEYSSSTERGISFRSPVMHMTPSGPEVNSIIECMHLG